MIYQFFVCVKLTETFSLSKMTLLSFDKSKESCFTDGKRESLISVSSHARNFSQNSRLRLSHLVRPKGFQTQSKTTSNIRKSRFEFCLSLLWFYSPPVALETDIRTFRRPLVFLHFTFKYRHFFKFFFDIAKNHKIMGRDCTLFSSIKFLAIIRIPANDKRNGYNLNQSSYYFFHFQLILSGII